MHRSGGAGECVEEDDGDGGEEKGCDDHQIGEGARRHIRVASASASAFFFFPDGGRRLRPHTSTSA